MPEYLFEIEESYHEGAPYPWLLVVTPQFDKPVFGQGFKTESELRDAVARLQEIGTRPE